MSEEKKKHYRYPVPGPGRTPKVLTREQILGAQKATLSNRAAAVYLHVTLPTFRKYAKLYIDEETGQNLYDLHKNPSGRGIPKFVLNPGTGKKTYSKRIPVMEILSGKVPAAHFNPRKLRELLVRMGLLKEECYQCGYHERRPLDGKIPLILVHKDGNKNNWNLDNLEFICYNCSFQRGPDSFITEEMVEKAEDMRTRIGTKIEETYELSDYQKKYLDSLFPEEKKKKPGEEFIDRF